MPTTTETTNVRKQGPITLIGDFWFGDRVALIDAEGATIRKGYVSGTLHFVNVAFDDECEPFSASNPVPEGCSLVKIEE